MQKVGLFAILYHKWQAQRGIRCPKEFFTNIMYDSVIYVIIILSKLQIFVGVNFLKQTKSFTSHLEHPDQSEAA